jgi:hypothetical protein
MLDTLSPNFTFKNLYDNHNELVEYFNSKEVILNSFPLTADTSAISAGLFGYVNGSGAFVPAHTTTKSSWAEYFVVVSGTEGSLIQCGIAEDAQVESGITITAGDIIYLTASSSDPGKVTNVPTAQYLGKALSNSALGKVKVWFRIIDSNLTLTKVDEFDDGAEFTSGTTTQLTLSVTPSAKENIAVYFDGSLQEHSGFTLSGNVITFDSAISATKVEVIIRYAENAYAVVEPKTENTTVVSSGTIATEVYRTYVINGSKIIINLPAIAGRGDYIKIIDMSKSRNCVVQRNGKKIMGRDEDLTIDDENVTFTLLYTETDPGWVVST